MISERILCAWNDAVLICYAIISVYQVPLLRFLQQYAIDMPAVTKWSSLVILISSVLTYVPGDIIIFCKLINCHLREINWLTRYLYRTVLRLNCRQQILICRLICQIGFDGISILNAIYMHPIFERHPLFLAHVILRKHMLCIVGSVQYPFLALICRLVGNLPVKPYKEHYSSSFAVLVFSKLVQFFIVRAVILNTIGSSDITGRSPYCM